MKLERLVILGTTLSIGALIALNYCSGLINHQKNGLYPQNSIITQTQKLREKTLSDAEKLRILAKMFPAKNISCQNGKFINIDPVSKFNLESYYIDKAVSGSFINPNKNETLIVIRQPKEELSHTDGFYNAYMAVFDQNGDRLLSGIQRFLADSGEYTIFKGRNLSYLLFVKVTTFQSTSSWSVNLWKAGKKWTKKWTLADHDSPDESLPAGIGDGGLKVFKKVFESNSNSERIIPKWKLEYQYTLIWDQKTEQFVKNCRL